MVYLYKSFLGSLDFRCLLCHVSVDEDCRRSPADLNPKWPGVLEASPYVFQIGTNICLDSAIN